MIAPLSSTVDGSCNAAILAAVGVLKGRRLRGGRRRGCSLFLFVTGGALAVVSISRRGPSVRPRLPRPSRSLLEASSVAANVGLQAVVEVLATLPASNGRLDLRTAKNGWSSSAFGDSYAFGMAGTGGTSSAPSAGLLSLRGLGVGSLDVDKF